MGLRIATNTQSLSVQRHLGIEGGEQKQALEKLASGSRINRAADDAAGLAVSEKMRSMIRSVGGATRNAGDAISLVQTAEGGMNEISNILVRFRELSIQAASDTVTDVERGFINKEVQQLKQEVTRIASSTEFNGKKILDGQSGVLDFQIGLYGNADGKITYNAAETDVTADRLGIGSITTATKEDAQNNLGVLDSAIREVGSQRATLGALQNRLISTTNDLQIYKENMMSSRSQIADADFAQVTADLTRQNILTQAGIAILGQANANSKMALNLLGSS